MILFAVLIFLSVTALCEEGFDENRYKLPSAVARVWDATYAVSPKTNGSSGSSLFIRKENGPQYGQYYFYFLTSGHVVRGNCGLFKGPCANLKLTTGTGFDQVTNQEFKTSETFRSFENVEVVKISIEPDLALLRARVDSSLFFSLNPVAPDKNCKIKSGTTVYILGFPGVHHRINTKGTTEQNKFKILKRFSKGTVVGPESSAIYPDGSQSQWLSTTADSLPGNSGGPAVDPEGNVIGTLDGSIKTNDDGISYKGTHALLERCESINSFLATP
jgi:hypothetical protein